MSLFKPCRTVFNPYEGRQLPYFIPIPIIPEDWIFMSATTSGYITMSNCWRRKTDEEKEMEQIMKELDEIAPGVSE